MWYFKLWIRVGSSWIKTYNYLADNSNENKTTNATKSGAIKQKLKFRDYKYCLELTWK